MEYSTILRLSEMLYNLEMRLDNYTSKLKENKLAEKFGFNFPIGKNSPSNKNINKELAIDQEK